MPKPATPTKRAPRSPHRITLQIKAAFRPALDRALLRTTALAALTHPKSDPHIAHIALTVVITDDATVQALNHAYRGVDAPTDVLSFSAHDLLDADAPTLSDDTHTYLGDVLIAYPQAARQAEAGGHTTQAEIQLLLVHGILHLLGHDHAATPARRRMWAAQAAILTALDAPLTRPTAASLARH